MDRGLGFVPPTPTGTRNAIGAAVPLQHSSTVAAYSQSRDESYPAYQPAPITSVFDKACPVMKGVGVPRVQSADDTLLPSVRVPPIDLTQEDETDEDKTPKSISSTKPMQSRSRAKLEPKKKSAAQIASSEISEVTKKLRSTLGAVDNGLSEFNQLSTFNILCNQANSEDARRMLLRTLLATKSKPILKRYIAVGGIGILKAWLEDNLANKGSTLVFDALHQVFGRLPNLTLEDLEKADVPSLLKQARKNKQDKTSASRAKSLIKTLKQVVAAESEDGADAEHPEPTSTVSTSKVPPPPASKPKKAAAPVPPLKQTKKPATETKKRPASVLSMGVSDGFDIFNSNGPEAKKKKKVPPKIPPKIVPAKSSLHSTSFPSTSARSTSSAAPASSIVPDYVAQRQARKEARGPLLLGSDPSASTSLKPTSPKSSSAEPRGNRPMSADDIQREKAQERIRAGQDPLAAVARRPAAWSTSDSSLTKPGDVPSSEPLVSSRPKQSTSAGIDKDSGMVVLGTRDLQSILNRKPAKGILKRRAKSKGKKGSNERPAKRAKFADSKSRDPSSPKASGNRVRWNNELSEVAEYEKDVPEHEARLAGPVGKRARFLEQVRKEKELENSIKERARDFRQRLMNMKPTIVWKRPVLISRRSAAREPWADSDELKAEGQYHAQELSTYIPRAQLPESPAEPEEGEEEDPNEDDVDVIPDDELHPSELMDHPQSSSQSGHYGSQPPSNVASRAHFNARHRNGSADTRPEPIQKRVHDPWNQNQSYRTGGQQAAVGQSQQWRGNPPPHLSANDAAKGFLDGLDVTAKPKDPSPRDPSPRGAGIPRRQAHGRGSGRRPERCRYFSRPGGCDSGDRCRFAHEK